jgi:hypothetical protein
MKNLFLLFVIALVSACGTTGVQNKDLLSLPIAKKQARIMVERDTSLLYMGAAARVEVNGSDIASLGRGGSVVYEIPTGRNMISTTAFGTFGNYSLSFEASQGKLYSFVISPRGEAMSHSMFGLLGEAVSAEINENSGYFKIELKEVK